jgi:hypothetical protein
MSTMQRILFFAILAYAVAYVIAVATGIRWRRRDRGARVGVLCAARVVIPNNRQEVHNARNYAAARLNCVQRTVRWTPSIQATAVDDNELRYLDPKAVPDHMEIYPAWLK